MNSVTRLTMYQVTQLCGQSIGRLRADPTFPPMHRGTFDKSAVETWKAARDAKATPAAPATPLEK